MRLTARHERLNTKTEKMNEKKKEVKVEVQFHSPAPGQQKVTGRRKKTTLFFYPAVMCFR